MITVTIFINGNPIITRSAYRIEGMEHGVCKYHVDDGSTITHHYDDGACTLAKKMLDTVKEKAPKTRSEQWVDERIDEIFKRSNSK